jgi:hypothetical protein
MLNTLDTSIPVSDSQTLNDLLTFSLAKVKNLYSLDLSSQVFKFEHKDGEYVAKANGKLSSDSALFEASYVDSFKTDFGITYVGYILIEYFDSSFNILIPAEKSYDPAGPAHEAWVESRQINKLIIFVCVMITAARFGAESRFVRRLFKVMKPIIEKYYKKQFLFKWMYSQVRLACFKQKEPQSYTEFIGNSDIENATGYKNDVKLVQSGTIERVSFPEEYSTVIREVREAEGGENDVVEGVVEGAVDFVPQCFSPELEDDVVPNVQEIRADLVKVKEKYEDSIGGLLKKIAGLKIS